jgi:hypothetical protein
VLNEMADTKQMGTTGPFHTVTMMAETSSKRSLAARLSEAMHSEKIEIRRGSGLSISGESGRGHGPSLFILDYQVGYFRTQIALRGQ